MFDFDRSAIEMHIGLLHDLAAGCDGILTLIAIEESEAAQVQRFRIGDADPMIETIMGFEGRPWINLYAPWAVMRSDLPPRKKGGESDVVACLAAIADLDNDKHKFGELPVEPSYVIETSPGNYQAFYFFDQPLSASKAKPVLAALCDSVGGDSGTKDVAHVWRIPGTLNIPTKSKLARGRSPLPAHTAIKKHFDGCFTNTTTLLALAPKNPKPNGDASQFSSSLSAAEAARIRDALTFVRAMIETYG
jgi:RepB DNA-primase from phage plasmid